MTLLVLFQGGGQQVVIVTHPGGGRAMRLLMLGMSLVPALVMLHA